MYGQTNNNLYNFWQILIYGCLLSLAFSCSLRGVLGKKSTDTSLAYNQSPEVLAKGKQLFNNYCSTCHNFSQRGIGPSLDQVTKVASATWIKKFVKNAQEMIDQRDPRALELYNSYQQVMPPFEGLKDADLDAILSYIHSERRLVKPQYPELPGGIINPIEPKIAKSGWVLDLKHVATAPPTDAKAPIARINQMRILPGEKERWFVHDLRGFLYELIDNKWEIALDISQGRPNFINSPGMGTGLGSFAFHPEFYQNGLFYTTHTEAAGSKKADFAYPDSIKVTLQWVLSEWKIDDPKAIPLKGQSRELLRINMVTGIHGVQECAFRPTAKPGDEDYGLLYIGVGDGGASENGYPFICHDKSRIWSSVIRIDPRGKNSKNGQYGIPIGNPYAKMSDAQACREVFCRGFRNPNRFTWTPDGRMLIADIGHANIEELNIGQAGSDHGWPYREGTYVIHPTAKMDRVYPLPSDDTKQNYFYPVLQFDHDEGKAIEGGFVYQGKSIPFLQGKYIFGDVASGRVFFAETKDLVQGQQATIQELDLKIDSKIVTMLELNKGIKPDFRIGVGPENELYFFTKSDGKVYRILECGKE
jgi:mono/diheme cytochrome c family protein